jgi:hypothetical protein
MNDFPKKGAMYTDWPTTRRYSRTADDAFRTPDYAQAIWLDTSPRARFMRWLRRLLK